MNTSNNFDLLRNLGEGESYPRQLLSVVKKHSEKDAKGNVQLDSEGKIKVNKNAVVNELLRDPSRLASLIDYMKIEGNEHLVRKISQNLYKKSLEYLENPEVKKVATAIRNRQLLTQPNPNTDFTLAEKDFTSPEKEEKAGLLEHKTILVLESQYFRTMKDFKEKQMKEAATKAMEIPREIYKFVMDYIYSSNEERKKSLEKLSGPEIDKEALVDIAQLADLWRIDEALKIRCDEELCKALLNGDIGITKDDLEDWKKLSHILPKMVRLVNQISIAGEDFTPLVNFINKAAKEEKNAEFEPIIKQMQTKETAKELVTRCTVDELAFFTTQNLNMDTEFGKALGEACRTFNDTFVHEKHLDDALQFMKGRPVGDQMIIKQPDNSLYSVVKDAQGDIQFEEIGSSNLKHKGSNLVDKDSAKYQMPFTESQARRFIDETLPPGNFFIYPNGSGSFSLVVKEEPRGEMSEIRTFSITKTSQDPKTPVYMEDFTRRNSVNTSTLKSVMKYFTDREYTFYGPDTRADALW